MTDAFEGRFETQDGALLGTPYYMAPEQVNGNPIGPKADLYARCFVSDVGGCPSVY